MKPDLTADGRHRRADAADIDDIVKAYLPSAPPEEMEADAARVLQRLRSMSRQAGDRAGDDCFANLEAVSSPRWPWMTAVAAVAAVLLAVIAATVDRRGPAAINGAENLDGASYLASGKPIHADRDAMVALPDGSRVEMHDQSELSLERADDGLRIRLHTGSIIVNAAKQQQGHLYVQTKDMTVSVVGTIFLVNAEEAGSRVA